MIFEAQLPTFSYQKPTF